MLAAWLAGARNAAGQLDPWRRREESMRMVRWAADKSSAQTDDERLVALSVLDALNRSKPTMLQDEDQGIWTRCWKRSCLSRPPWSASTLTKRATTR